MKKIISVAVILLVLLVIGKTLTNKEANELSEDIVRSVTKGNYYDALENANKIELLGKKMPKKTSKLVEDVKLYQEAQRELDEIYSMNLGRVQALLEAMNGSYKKYDIFNSDVETMKEQVEKLEEYGNEGVEVVEKAEELIKNGDKAEAQKLLAEYCQDERFEKMPNKLIQTINDLLNQARKSDEDDGEISIDKIGGARIGN